MNDCPRKGEPGYFQGVGRGGDISHAFQTMGGYLRQAPRWATIVSILVAGGAIAHRGVWPTPWEIGTLALSFIGVYGAFQLQSPRSRAVCAGLWVALLISLGVPTPSRLLGGDFGTFYYGARSLYQQHQSPYLAYGATAFPFPTFLLVHLLSLGGRLSFESTFLSFTVLELALLGVSVLLMRRVIIIDIPRKLPDLAGELICISLVFHPAVLNGVGWGNSGVIASVALIFAVWFWRCGAGNRSLHASAISINLAWMVKPQLIMTIGYFLICWCLERRRNANSLSRAAAIGRLVVPWASAVIVLSLLPAFPASIAAYRDFPEVAVRWHTQVAEGNLYNQALSVLLAKYLARIWSLPASRVLPFITVGIALSLVVWNLLELMAGKMDSLRAFLPWLTASLLWTSLLWDWYLTLILASLFVMTGLQGKAPTSRTLRVTATLCAGIALTMIPRNVIFVLGALLLYFHSHDLRLEELADAQETAT